MLQNCSSQRESWRLEAKAKPDSRAAKTTILSFEQAKAKLNQERARKDAAKARKDVDRDREEARRDKAMAKAQVTLDRRAKNIRQKSSNSKLNCELLRPGLSWKPINGAGKKGGWKAR
jgi:hypothetical protein